MNLRVIRIIFGAALAIFLMVGSFLIIGDFYYLNKGSDYARMTDSRISHIGLDFLWYLIMAAVVYGLPCLIYMSVIEWRRGLDKGYYTASVIFGILFGISVGVLVIPSFNHASRLELAEGFTHFIAVAFIISLVVPCMMKLVGNDIHKNKANKSLHPTESSCAAKN